jgi:preprotein translocase subunit SecA
MYDSIAGMTGTAKTEEEELQKIYNLDVWVVPTNKEIKRKDDMDIIYQTKKHKWEAIAKEIEIRHKKGQPVLAGTASIESSEQLSAVLKKMKINHELLNAKNHKKEAEIIAKAGKRGSVTIATNMAGRGTDIKIDEESRNLGGLCVLGTEKHDSRRIDNQLKGRSGRQGDPGYSQFYISLEDELVLRLQGDKMKVLIERLGIDESEPIQSKIINKNFVSFQKRMEGSNFDSRKNLMDYESVTNEQMLEIYGERNAVMNNQKEKEFIKNQIDEYVEMMSMDIDITSNPEVFNHILDGKLEDLNIDWLSLSPEQRKSTAKKEINELYNAKRVGKEEAFDHIERFLFLEILDTNWTSHLDALTSLKEGIHLRSYAQVQPEQEYKREALEIYNHMIENIKKEYVENLIRIEVE